MVVIQDFFTKYNFLSQFVLVTNCMRLFLPKNPPRVTLHNIGLREKYFRRKISVCIACFCWLFWSQFFFFQLVFCPLYFFLFLSLWNLEFAAWLRWVLTVFSTVMTASLVGWKSNRNQPSKGNMWSAIPVTLLCMFVNVGDGQQGSGSKGGDIL